MERGTVFLEKNYASSLLILSFLAQKQPNLAKNWLFWSFSLKSNIIWGWTSKFIKVKMKSNEAVAELDFNFTEGKVHEKSKTKLKSVSFMYVCVAENAKLLDFFTFFLHLPQRQFSFINLCLSSKMY